MNAVGPEYYEEGEEAEIFEPEPHQKMVVYCLVEECPLTSWLHETEWSDNKERSQMVVEGEPSMMGPYCPSCRKQREGGDPSQAA